MIHTNHKPDKWEKPARIFSLTVLIALLILSFTGTCKGQYCRPYGNYAVTKVTAAVIVDQSFRYYKPTGFTGFGLHAGVWIDWIGFTGLLADGS